MTVLLSELYVILLEDILVLLQKQDERLLLKFHGKNQAGAADTKSIFSPVIKLSTVLVRPVATGEGGAALWAVIGPSGRFHPGFVFQTTSHSSCCPCLKTELRSTS